MNAPIPLSIPQFPEQLVSDTAEAAVVGALLADQTGAAFDKLADQITDRDFWHADLRVIFQAIAALARAGKPVDVITVAEKLEALHLTEKAGGDHGLPARLLELSKAPTAGNVARYAEMVRDKGILRRLWGAAIETQESLARGRITDVAATVNEAQERVYAVAEQARAGDHVQTAREVLARTVANIDALAARKSEHEVTGLATGFRDLDAMTTGLHPGDLVVVAARPSMGKTAFVLNVIQHVTGVERRPVMMFSLEMANEGLMTRLLAQKSGINSMRLRTGRLYEGEWRLLSDAQAQINAGADCLLDESNDVTIAEIRSRARRFSRQCGGVRLVIVDYLGLIKARDERINRVEQVAEISRGLKKLAKELACPVMVLSQLNRSLESRPDKRPIMSDLRDSGAVEQDADIILGLYRDEVYNRESPDKGLAELLILKQRNGPTGMVPLRWDGNLTSFSNAAPGTQPATSGYKARRAPQTGGKHKGEDDDHPEF